VWNWLLYFSPDYSGVVLCTPVKCLTRLICYTVRGSVWVKLEYSNQYFISLSLSVSILHRVQCIAKYIELVIAYYQTLLLFFKEQPFIRTYMYIHTRLKVGTQVLPSVCSEAGWWMYEDTCLIKVLHSDMKIYRQTNVCFLSEFCSKS
jgi:hypothetical protein